MNSLSPCALWRKDSAAASHINDIVNSVQFKSALTFALAEYAQEASGKPDAGARVAGVREFIDKLLNMGNEPTMRQVPTFNLPKEGA